MKTPLWTLAFSLLTATASNFFPARPPAVPLAVKSPYLSIWLPSGSDGGDGGSLSGETTTFWDGVSKAWTGLIRVDGQTYTWMGLPGPQAATQKSLEYTSTKSIFVLDIGSSVELTATFSSPLTPNDMKRMSLVFSYLDVSVVSRDGNLHDVQLYVDITGEWASGNPNSEIEWAYGTTHTGVTYHQICRQTQLLWSETNDQAEWGNWYLATQSGTGMSHQSGSNTTVRGQFTKHGNLTNTEDQHFRAINNNLPTFGFAQNLGRVSKKPINTLFTVGLTQEQAIQFDGGHGNVSVPSLWVDYFGNGVAALDFHFNDYNTAFAMATSFDNQVMSDSLAAGGQNYLTITSLSARQAFGATQLCGTQKKMYLFLKEISSDGNVQTVDVIFPFHTILAYTNPELLKLLLDPLFENQAAGQWPKKYSLHDLGAHYPNATGHIDGVDEMQPLEECGNMLIMTLAYAQRAPQGIDVGYLSQNYQLLNQWTQYLVEEALIPANQISTDDFAGSLPNQTNLALKGIIGIEAMATVANLTGHHEDGANYTKIAHDYITKWQRYGIAFGAKPPHTTLGYGLNNTHGLLYNLFGDRELNLNLVPESVYEMQSNFYPTVGLRYGVPLDTRHNYTKADWQMFAASIAAPETQQLFTRDVATWINQTTTNLPLTDLYDAVAGNYPPGITFIARPVMGGSFAILTLNGAADRARYVIGTIPSPSS